MKHLCPLLLVVFFEILAVNVKRYKYEQFFAQFNDITNNLFHQFRQGYPSVVILLMPWSVICHLGKNLA